MSELEKFEEAPEGIDIELPAGGKEDGPGHSFSAGDNVEVSQGELMHLQGKILAIDGTMISVMPKHEDLTVSKILYVALKAVFCFDMNCTTVFF